MMSQINTRVVRRSWRLYENTQNSYGPNFAYKAEGMYLGRNPISAWILAILLIIIDILLYFPIIRSLFRRFALRSGDGPSEEVRKSAKVWIRITGEIDGVKGKKAYVDVRGGDLGYSQTAEMVTETALMLAEVDQLRVKGGVVTPAFAFGTALADRLNRNTKVEFKTGTL